VIVPELEFRRIAVQMFLGAVLVHTLHAALEDAEIAIDGIGVDRAAAPLALTVLDERMSREFTV